MRAEPRPLQRLLAWRPRASEATFQLTRAFTVTILIAFAVLGTALFLLQRNELRFFESVQHNQSSYMAKVQGELLVEQKDMARANLVSVHEASHVTLARVFANALWASHFAPLVAQAQAVGLDGCVPVGEGAAAAPAQAAAQQACLERHRRRVMALPAFAGVDPPVRALMRSTNVFKIKVYDLRGLTVYSSEPEQIGEVKSDNAGWRAAAAGRPASELVHRNRFSAFEGVVEDRDLIQSYVPVAAPGGGIGGVFEIYSDVTPLLQQIDTALVRIAQAAAGNQARVVQAAERNQYAVESAGVRLLAIIAALLALTYLALLFLVRSGQRIIDRESRARAQAALREQEWHRDKMATMGAMAANISHEVGNPLAIISGLAEEIGHWKGPGDIDPVFPRMIVEQTARIAGMTRRISDFATAGHETPEALDLNQLVRAVCEFLAFDRRFNGTPIDLRLAEGLPACQAIPDHLTEALMGLLQALEKACEECAAGGRICMETAAADGGLVMRIRGECPGAPDGCQYPLADPRLDSARRRLEGMGGRITIDPGGVEIRLPAADAASGAGSEPPPQ